MFSSRAYELATLLALAGLSGCGGSTIHTAPVALDPAATAKGAVYFLPKSLLVVKLNVAVTPAPKPTCGNGINSADCDLEVNKFSLRDISIETLSVPDTTHAFLIETNGSFVVKTEFTAAFNDRGELASSTSKATSQAVQFATTGLEVLAKVVGTVAMAGTSTNEREALATQARKLAAAITTIDQKIETGLPLLNPQPAAAPPQPPAKPAPKTTLGPKPAEVVDEVTDLLELRAKLSTLLSEVRAKLTETEIVLPVACVVDPSIAVEWKLDTTCDAYRSVKTALTGAGIAVNGALPSLELSLSHQGGPTAPGTAPQKRASGFYYRIPAWFEAEAIADTGARARMSVAIPQRGQLALWELGEKDLRSGKTIAIELHPGLGSVKSVSLNADPVSTDDVKGLMTAAKGITTAAEDAEVDALKRETAKLDAERGVLEARKKLEDARNPKPEEETAETK